ncbi:hypothetical protein [Mumia zhuanghuii]|uniref:Uncharacterized protein n=1 Tax=Mumia zhuanghuii TaxID=2585211 RepID=A0A5C4MR17_9ACTN|nr:hypothetical protein [Mumia zhuanghuii]TNC47054.1 hypothetical protein FHE65_10550 [Mumia zhuanghuii]TNC50390.1 hypothetical protein FHE65_03755 [Mumia zhuanghuii]
MSEHTHLLLLQMREKEFYRTLEQRRRRNLTPPTPWRARLAASLRHTADRLDHDSAEVREHLVTTR